MKSDTAVIIRQVIALVILCALVIGFFSFMWFVLIKPDIDNKKFCEDRLNVNYSYWDGVEGIDNLRFEEIGDYHINCCWDEVYLVNNEYYAEKKCKGYVKGVTKNE